MRLTLNFQAFFLRKNRNLVSIDDFTEYLSVFQKIIYIIAEEKGFREDVKDFRFLVKKIKLDSFDCVIESYLKSKDVEEEDPVEHVVKEFEDISRLIDKKEREQTFSRLKEKVKNPETRISLYNYFDRIIPKENKAFQIFTKERSDPDSKRIFVSKKRYKRNINIWRQMDKKPKLKIRTFIGIIKTLNAYREGKKFVKIIDQYGNKIQYYYKKKEREKFTKLYDSDIIKIRGIYDPYQKTISNLIEIEKMDHIELSKIKDLEFKYPVSFKLEYNYGIIYGSNEELGVFATGFTYNEMLDDLYNRIKTTIEMYLNPEITFTESSLKHRQRFLDLFV